MKITLPSAQTAVPSLFILAFMASLGPFGDTEYTPSLPAIAGAMNVDYGKAQLTMTVYLVGFALGQLLYGPFSDRFGRRPAILFAISTFLAGSLICMVSINLPMILFGRFVQSLGACAGVIIANAAVRDAFSPESRTVVFLEVNMAFSVAPGIGPIVGSLIDHYWGWAANFFLLAALATVLLICLLFFFPETIREKRPKATHPDRLIKNYLSLFSHLSFVYYVLLVGIGTVVVYCSLVEAPNLVVNQIGLPTTTYVIITLCITASFILGAGVCGLLSKFFTDPQLVIIGLLIMLTGSLAIGFFDYLNWVTLPTMLSSMSFIFSGIAFVCPVSTSLAMAPFQRVAGSASSMIGCVSMGMAAAGTYFISILPNRPSFDIFFTFTLLSGLGLLSTLLIYRFAPQIVSPSCHDAN
jgi:DHA1 family bicyclomycin/chloramphenicol resistance-like MFS transporter